MIYPIRFLLFSAAVFFSLSVHGILPYQYKIYFDALAIGGLLTYATWIYEQSGE